MSWKYRLVAALSASVFLFVLFLLCYFAFLLIVFAVVPFGDGHNSVRGKVSDTDGKTIAGARVMLTELESSGVPESRNMSTDEQGEYSVGITHYPTNKKRFILSLLNNPVENRSLRKPDLMLSFVHGREARHTDCLHQ
jgi:hypothetical protein